MPLSKDEVFALTVDTHLRLLCDAVEDDTVARVVDDIHRLIRIEEFLTREMIRYNQDKADDVLSGGGNYIEDLIGASLVLLQAKISRVVSCALAVRQAATEFELDLPEFDGQVKILALGGTYQDTGSSVVELVWHLGNYYKHRDQWSRDTWEQPERKTEKTIEGIAKVGIGQHGDLRTAFEFFGLDTHIPDCVPLAKEVQEWAERVYGYARAQLPVDPEIQPRVRMANKLRRRLYTELYQRFMFGPEQPLE
jgi:hypothetical protein